MKGDGSLKVFILIQLFNREFPQKLSLLTKLVSQLLQPDPYHRRDNYGH